MLNFGDFICRGGVAQLELHIAVDDRREEAVAIQLQFMQPIVVLRRTFMHSGQLGLKNAADGLAFLAPDALAVSAFSSG